MIAEEDFINIKSETIKIFKNSKLTLRRMRHGAIASFLVGLVIFGLYTGINTYNSNTKELSKKIQIKINLRSVMKEVTVEGLRLSLKDSVLIIEK